MELVTSCNTVADDMKARYCSPDHDVMAQGLCALTPGSEIFLNPPHIVSFAKLFRVTENKSLLTAQLLTMHPMIEKESNILSLKDLGDYCLVYQKALSLVLECISVAQSGSGHHHAQGQGPAIPAGVPALCLQLPGRKAR